MTQFKLNQLKKSPFTPLMLKKIYFEQSGGWTRPEEMVGDQAFITIIGAGGHGSNNNANGVAGNGGAYEIDKPIDISSVAIGESIAITVGEPSTTYRTTSSPLVGGASSFGSFLTVGGGGGGAMSTAQNSSNVGGNVGGRPGSYGSNGKGAGIGGGTVQGGIHGSAKSGGGGGLVGILNMPRIKSFSGADSVASDGIGHGAGSGVVDNTNNNFIPRGAAGIVVVQYYVEVT